MARKFEPSANAMRKWVKQPASDECLRSDGLTTAEREELNRLRWENRVLREEREILAGAAAWCVSRTLDEALSAAEGALSAAPEQEVFTPYLFWLRGELRLKANSELDAHKDLREATACARRADIEPPPEDEAIAVGEPRDLV